MSLNVVVQKSVKDRGPLERTPRSFEIAALLGDDPRALSRSGSIPPFLTFPRKGGRNP